MLTVSFTHPHDPYVMRRAYWDRYDHDSIDMPRIGRGDVDEDPHSLRLRHVSAMDTVEINDDMVRNARHGYYACISYVDDWVARLLDTLEATGMDGDTLVIFTADHGDHLGERGLWYKMSFFEPSTRIPLIIRTPDGDGVRGVTVADHVSLQDMLPTLVDVAGGDAAGDLGHPVDGTSLLPQLHGHRDPDRVVLGEYLGEGAVAPILMIRRRHHKYVWSEPDGAQLYDLAADPDETRNLAEHPDHAATAAAFRAEIDKHWQPDLIANQVVASQRARRVVDRALRVGRYTPWDHNPVTEVANQYMRNHLDLRDVEVSRRHPRPLPRPVGPTAM